MTIANENIKPHTNIKTEFFGMIEYRTHILENGSQIVDPTLYYVGPLTKTRLILLRLFCRKEIYIQGKGPMCFKNGKYSGKGYDAFIQAIKQSKSKK